MKKTDDRTTLPLKRITLKPLVRRDLLLAVGGRKAMDGCSYWPNGPSCTDPPDDLR